MSLAELARFDFIPEALRLEAGLALQIVLVLLVMALVALGLIVFTRRIARRVAEAGPSAAQEQRIRTLIGLGQTVGLVVIIGITIFMIVAVLGVNIGPVLAAAGVLGLAVSFGAQTLVRDVISGLFMLAENQFGVGDVVRIGETGGIVEKVTLRIIVLRDVHGVVHMIPNGEVKQLSNLTRSWSRSVLEIPVAYKEDVDHVIEVLRDVGREMWEDEEWRPLLLEEITVPGVESFADSGVMIRVMAKTVPLKQWDIGRELRRRIKKRFDAEGIEIPFPHRTLFWGAGQSPDGHEASGDRPAVPSPRTSP